MFETIIIGAGPAGLIAGRYLKDALILEQKEGIGLPVQCAEGLAKKFLDQLEIKPNPAWISAVIETSQVILPNGKVVSLISQKKGYILDRVRFEKFLAGQSKAQILLKKRVVDLQRENNFWGVKTREGEVFKSKYLLGADGPFSLVRRKVFKEEVETLPCIEYLVELEKEIDTSTMKLYFDKERFPFGYAWIFPKSKNKANIGLGGKGNLKESFEQFIEKTVKKEFGNCKLLENRSGVVPWGGASIKLAKDNALLLGDAGGLADPIFGGGIGNAMLSGQIAAQSVLSGQALSYQSRIKSLPYFSKDLLLAQKIIYSFDNRFLNEIGQILENKDIFYLKSFPALFDFLAKPNLRKNFLKILTLLFIYYKNKGLSWV